MCAGPRGWCSGWEGAAMGCRDTVSGTVGVMRQGNKGAAGCQKTVRSRSDPERAHCKYQTAPGQINGAGDGIEGTSRLILRSSNQLLLARSTKRPCPQTDSGLIIAGPLATVASRRATPVHSSISLPNLPTTVEPSMLFRLSAATLRPSSGR